MRRLLPIILPLFLMLVALDVTAQIPRTISFQGILAGPSGAPLPDGPQTLVLSIYDAPAGGAALHTETQTVQVMRGVFSVIIGQQGGIAPTVRFDSPYYLGVKVGSDAEMTPRTPMTAVPYALNSAMAMVADSARSAFRSRVSDSSLSLRGGAVTSVNGQTGALQFVGTGSTQVTQAGNQITINSTDSTGILIVQPGDNIIAVDDIDGPITSIRLRELSIRTEYLVDGAVITPKILDGAVTSAKIADFGVESQDIAPNAVTSDKIADGNVNTAELADLSVTNPKLAANAVTAGKISTEGAAAGTVLLSNGGTTPVWGNALMANIPFTGTFNTAATLWSLTNTGTGNSGFFGVANAANTTDALTGTTSGTGSGVVGIHSATTGTAAGVRGETGSTGSSAVGVHGIVTSTTPGAFSAGVRGTNNGTGGFGIGVYGSHAGGGWGVYGTSPSGIALYGSSTSGFGLYAQSASGTGVYGVSVSGEAGRFATLAAANSSNALTGSTAGTGSAGRFEVNNSSSAASAVSVSTNGSGPAVDALSTGTGNALTARIQNASNANVAATVQTNGIGSGINVQLTNPTNFARGIDVLQTGFGPGVFSTSAGGIAVWGITSSISAAGVIGDNTFGEAVVGRSRGGNGVGAVVGRNDSAGYGVRGFSTKTGIGVLGQGGISGGTGVGGRFENVNAANTSDALQGATNGTGWAGNFTNTNNSSGSRGVRISTTAGQGGNALAVANGTVSFSYQNGYSSGGVVDDATLVITTAGSHSLATGGTEDGTTVWVINNSGGAVNITNTTVGSFGIAIGRAQQFLFVSAVSGSNWVPVQ